MTRNWGWRASCPCQFVVRSETTAPKPRVLTIEGAQGGTRTLILINLGPREESVTYRVMLATRSGSLAGAQSALSAGARGRAVGTKSLSAFRRRTD
jgi:hypothetical protein